MISKDKFVLKMYEEEFKSNFKDGFIILEGLNLCKSHILLLQKEGYDVENLNLEWRWLEIEGLRVETGVFISWSDKRIVKRPNGVTICHKTRMSYEGLEIE